MTETTAQSTKTPEAIDKLVEQLAFGSSLHFQSGFCSDWNMLTAKSAQPAMHVVTHGEVWVAFPDNLQQQFKMGPGDALFLSHSVRHWLSDKPLTAETQPAAMEAVCIPSHLERGLVCYDIEIGNSLTETLFRILPDHIHLPVTDQSRQLAQLIEIVRDETRVQRPGYEVAISRLSDVIVIHLLRQILSLQAKGTGLLAALHDDHIRPVIVSIMNDLAKEWTVESMSAHAFLSRSAFTERCQRVAAMTPKQILDTLRLQTARQRLIHSNETIDRLAEALGYQSATAFIRFFKQHERCSPGEFRARHN
ncbi:MAG: AraC family transcriptional regulator [Gammaproteobacteria bacterium]|nr:AraC family transcriptional regulator [Gammaproteobacteria bacterium]